MNLKSGRSKIQNPKSKIKVLVVDDSLTVRKRVIEILGTAPDMAVVGEAGDGKEAIELTEKLRPSVILMDIVMPVMSGLTATEYIMAYHPTAIIILSSSENRGAEYKSWDAMKAGALAKIRKDDAEKDHEKWKRNLISAVRAASRVHVIRRKGSLLKEHTVKDPGIGLETGTGDYNVIAIGASTGGPGVIANILKMLPHDLALPVLLVMHIADTPKNTFARWLNDNCSLHVSFASDGESLKGEKSRAFVAPPGKHMVVARGNIRLLDTPEVNFCKPSVDTLFQSIARDKTKRAIGVLLTGMGQDGALGLKAIRDNGGYTICQDESTSMIFGMPKAAIDIGAADEVLPDHRMAKRIIALTKVGK